MNGIKYLISSALAFLLLAACSSMTNFIYYEPQANGWKLEHAVQGEPNDEVIFRGDNYAIAVSAMTLSMKLKSVGPQFLPIIPVDGSNSVESFYESDAISIYMQFFLSANVPAKANIDFSSIKLLQHGQETSARSTYSLPISTLQKKVLVSMYQTIENPTKYQEEHGQFPTYQMVFPWSGEKPDSFVVIIPSEAIRINEKTIPATVITFKKKVTSKYQYFP